MSGSAQALPMAQRDDGIPTLTPEQARQAAPGALFRTADGRLMRRPGGAEIPTMTPEQARQAPAGTLFRTTDGRVIRARGATPSEAPAGGAPRVSEGAIVRQNGKRYQMRGGQFVEIGAAPQSVASPPAASPAEPPRAAPTQIGRVERPMPRVGFPDMNANAAPQPAQYHDPAPTEGLDATRRFSASGVRDSDIQPRPQQSRLTQVMSHPGNDPWTAASDIAADALVNGLSSVFAGAQPVDTNPVPEPSPFPPMPEPSREPLPVWRGLPDIRIPSWSERAQRRYPRPSAPASEGDR